VAEKQLIRNIFGVDFAQMPQDRLAPRRSGVAKSSIAGVGQRQSTATPQNW
jgi:hypothetical protein